MSSGGSRTFSISIRVSLFSVPLSSLVLEETAKVSMALGRVVSAILWLLSQNSESFVRTGLLELDMCKWW